MSRVGIDSGYRGRNREALLTCWQIKLGRQAQPVQWIWPAMGTLARWFLQSVAQPTAFIRQNCWPGSLDVFYCTKNGGRNCGVRNRRESAKSQSARGLLTWRILNVRCVAFCVHWMQRALPEIAKSYKNLGRRKEHKGLRTQRRAANDQTQGPHDRGRKDKKKGYGDLGRKSKKNIRATGLTSASPFKGDWSQSWSRSGTQWTWLGAPGSRFEGSWSQSRLRIVACWSSHQA